MPQYFYRVGMYTALVVMVSFLITIFVCPASAETVRVGNILLEYGEVGDNPLLRAFNEGLLNPTTFMEEDVAMATITRPLNTQEKQQIQHATSYFAPFTARLSPDLTAKIYTGFNEDPKKSAFSYSPGGDLIQGGGSPNGSLYDMFISGRPVPGYPAYLADNIIIFQSPTYDSSPTRLLLNSQSVMGTMLHELGHAFGIATSYDIEKINGVPNPNSSTGTFTADRFTQWNAHLYDVFGKQAKPGMDIAMNAAGGKQDGVFQIFDHSTAPADITAYRYPTFKGPNVNALTGDVGMPVMGGFSNNGNGLDGANALGHPGIMNSIMSYGIIGNMPFTEMELAAFQDMGYAFDRSLYFGKSYYYTVGGDTQINTRGLGSVFAPNTTLFGLGTHIMRDGLKLTQQADIYAYGYGGGGIRIDGVNNTLLIPAGVTVAADGNMGTGLLVSYGSNNSITLEGTVRATGVGGIGAHFGVLASGGNVYSYASKIVPFNPNPNIQLLYEAERATKDMNGPLVSNFFISGTLAGEYVAIGIEDDVHVASITLLPGAKIEGHIVSRWSSGGFYNTRNDEIDAKSVGKFTDIVVGSAGTRAGHMFVTGNILGNDDSTNSLNITQAGGTLRFNGQADVSTWAINSDATLSGNSTITLRGGTPLSNAGTIAPGNSIGSITINGDFTNTGTLAMEFDGKGATDVLSVTGIFNHDTGSGANLSVSPVPSFYNGSMTINTASMFSGGTGSSLPTTITAFTPAASPTLTMSMIQNMPGTFSINNTRAADAYSRYAASGNAARVGRVLQGVAGVAQGDMQDMLARLDFSAVDGSGIRAALPQLTAAPYAQAAQASAEANLGIGRMALAQLRAVAGAERGLGGNSNEAGPERGLSGGDNSAQWSAFVMPFGGGSLQQADGGTPGYNSSQAGLMGGVFRQTEGMRLSLYSAFSRRQADMWTTAGAQARSTALHVGSTALWSENNSGTGSGWQAWGQAQLGVENTDMRRSVAFADYARQNNSFYSSFNGMAQLGGGYVWRADAFSFGPKVGLEYTFNSLPSITEASGGASRLGMDAYTRHDLRGVAGITTAWSTEVGEEHFFRAHLEAVWRQDMLPDQQNIRTHFEGYAQYPFDSRVKRQGQGSLGLTGGMEISLRQDVTLSAVLEADVLRPNYSSVGGGISLRWEF